MQTDEKYTKYIAIQQAKVELAKIEYLLLLAKDNENASKIIVGDPDYDIAPSMFEDL